MAAIPSITNTNANDPPPGAVRHRAPANAAAPTEIASVGLAPTLMGLTFAQLLLTGTLAGPPLVAPLVPGTGPPTSPLPRAGAIPSPTPGTVAPAAPARPATPGVPASADASEQLAQDVLDGVAALSKGDLGAFAGSLMRTARDTVMATLQLTRQAISYGSTIASIGASLNSS